MLLNRDSIGGRGFSLVCESVPVFTQHQGQKLISQVRLSDRPALTPPVESLRDGASLSCGELGGAASAAKT